MPGEAQLVAATSDQSLALGQHRHDPAPGMVDDQLAARHGDRVDIDELAMRGRAPDYRTLTPIACARAFRANVLKQFVLPRVILSARREHEYVRSAESSVVQRITDSRNINSRQTRMDFT